MVAELSQTMDVQIPRDLVVVVQRFPLYRWNFCLSQVATDNHLDEWSTSPTFTNIFVLAAYFVSSQPVKVCLESEPILRRLAFESRLPLVTRMSRSTATR